MRLAALLVLAGALAAAGAPSAHATNECRGLQVCVRVAGPWVVVPAALKLPRAHVDFQLSCPRGYLVGGLDTELTDRNIDVEFAGKDNLSAFSLDEVQTLRDRCNGDWELREAVELLLGQWKGGAQP